MPVLLKRIKPKFKVLEEINKKYFFSVFTFISFTSITFKQKEIL